MKQNTQSHAEIISKFDDLCGRLKPFKMILKSTGGLIVANESDQYGHKGYALYAQDIDVVEGFVVGLEAAKRISENSKAHSIRPNLND